MEFRKLLAIYYEYNRPADTRINPGDKACENIRKISEDEVVVKALVSPRSNCVIKRNRLLQKARKKQQLQKRKLTAF